MNPNPIKAIEKSKSVRNLRAAVRFIFNARMRHGNKFDYSNVNYSKSNEHVSIVCPVHGEFKQTPSQHTRSITGCPQCGKALLNIKRNTIVNNKKQCNCCKEWIHIDDFNSYNSTRKGKTRIRVQSYCKECEKRKGREQSKNADRLTRNRTQRRYYEKHKDRIRATARKKHSNVYFLVCECGEIEVNKQEVERTNCKRCYARAQSKKRYEPSVLVSKLCSHCNELFLPKKTNGERLCVKCKNVSKKKYRTQRKRAIEYGVYYELVIWSKVFRRDKYRCKECGVKTIKPTGKNLPNEWTKGHIVPMSKGGSNTYANAQCECRKCNTKKSNKALGQQLTIFYTERTK